MTEAKQTSTGTEVPAQLKNQHPGTNTYTRGITPHLGDRTRKPWDNMPTSSEREQGHIQAIQSVTSSLCLGSKPVPD